jgi:DNA-binding IclR family transcriptional regulator
LRYVLQVNARYPVYCSASGKLYLAFMSDHRREQYLKQAPFPARAKRTLTTRKALESAIRKVRSDRYSIDNEELVTGMIAVAVPVFSRDEQLIGTVAINATSARATTSDLIGFVPLLQQTANQIAAFTEAG